MLTYAAPRGIRQWAKIYRLYLGAFPASERKPFSIIVKMYRSGKTHVWYFTKENRFVGFAATINGEDHILLDYLAVRKKVRGTGVGGEMLRRICSRYAGKGVFLEIESAFEPVENREERLRRRKFYEHCGMESMDLFVWLFGVKMELLGFDCRLSYDEYRDFYRDNYSPWAADHIEKAEK